MAQDSYSQYQKKTAKFSFIAKNLEWKGIAVQDGNYTIWGCAPIQGEDGKTHLFVARWPEKNVNPAFLVVNDKYYLYAPSGWNIFGGDRTVGHVLKINLE